MHILNQTFSEKPAACYIAWINYFSFLLSLKVAKSPKLRRLSRDLLLEILDAIADYLKDTDLAVNP